MIIFLSVLIITYWMHHFENIHYKNLAVNNQSVMKVSLNLSFLRWISNVFITGWQCVSPRFVLKKTLITFLYNTFNSASDEVGRAGRKIAIHSFSSFREFFSHDSAWSQSHKGHSGLTWTKWLQGIRPWPTKTGLSVISFTYRRKYA